MKGFKSFWNTVSNSVYGIAADKWCHVSFGIAVAFVVAVLVIRAEPNAGEVLKYTDWLSAAAVGVLITVVLGFCKECLDALTAPRYEDEASRWDAKDWLFTAVGGVVGAALFLFGALTLIV